MLLLRFTGVNRSLFAFAIDNREFEFLGFDPDLRAFGGEYCASGASLYIYEAIEFSEFCVNPARQFKLFAFSIFQRINIFSLLNSREGRGR